MSVAQSVAISLEDQSSNFTSAVGKSVTLTVVHSSKPKPAVTLLHLYQQNMTVLVRSLAGKLQSLEDAEDIAQQAFIRIRPALERGELDNPAAYLYQTANNLAIDFLRHKKIQRNYVNGELDKFASFNGEFELDCCTPERLVIARDKIDRVTRAISELPENCRHAFILHRVKGHSYSDIAKAKGVSVSSVEKYILQALKSCRSAVETV